MMSQLLALTPLELGDPLALATSWMLTYLIHSTILILGVWLVFRGIPPLAKRLSPAAANLSWKLALVGGLVTATVQLAAGVTPSLGALELETGPKVVEAAPEMIVVERRTTPALADPSEAGVFGAVLAPAALAPLPVASPTVSEETPVWPKILLAVWLIGALIALARLLVSAIGLRRRLANRKDVIDDPVLESFLVLCHDAQIKRKIRLTQTERIASPIALWRKEVVVPTRAVEELTPAAMRAVLAHEVAHLERRDPLWLAFAAVLEALLIFQPLNRLALRGMRDSAELLCDDWAIAHTGDGVQFAKSLAELASWTQANRSSLLLAGMIGGERPLVRRVRRALDGDPQRFDANEGARPTRTLLSLGTLAALIMFAPGAVNASPPKAEDKADRKARKAQDKAEREAAKAQERALEAREKAEQAAREAEEAAREAERAARSAAPEAHGPQHLIIRDGEDYLIIDDKGVRMRGDGADIEISDGANPKMRIRVHDDDFDLDLDVDAETLEGMADALMGEMMGEMFGGSPHGVPGMGPGAPGGTQGTPRGFDGFDGFDSFADLDALAEQFGAWGEHFGAHLEEELQRELGQQQEQLDQLDQEALERQLEEAAREIERELQELRSRKGNSQPRSQRAPFPSFAPPAPPAAPAPPAVAPMAPTPPASPVVAI